jgi:hypothetical protein
MKVYRNRFASMEQQSCGGWIVYNEVAGLPFTGETLEQMGRGSKFGPKVFSTYNDAREVMSQLTERYKTISAGRRPNFS